MSLPDDRPDPDDLFSHTRMSLGDHIEELRAAILSAFKGFMLGLILGFFVAEPLLAFIRAPIERQLKAFHDERVKEDLKRIADSNDPNYVKMREPQDFPVEVQLKELANRLGIKSSDLSDDWIKLPARIRPNEMYDVIQPLQSVVGPTPTLITLTITEGFTVWCLVSVYCGIVLSAPWVFYQIWAFVAAGLYPQEKQYVHVFMPMSLTLFLLGVLLCQFVVLPIGISWLLSFTKWVGVEPVLRLSDWLSFAILMPVMFGVAFQLPLVMYFLYKVGIFTIESYTRGWQLALMVILILSCFLSASPDPLSALCMAVPMWSLYFLGIWLCVLWPNPAMDLEEETAEEMVEV